MRLRRLMMSADAVGGVWTYALELARGLAQEGVQTLLAVLGPAPDIRQRQQAETVPGLLLRHGDFPLEWMDDALPAQAAAGEWLLGEAHAFGAELIHLNHYGHGGLPWPAPVLMVGHSCVLSWFEAVRGEPAGCLWQDYRRHVQSGLAAAGRVVAPTHAMLEQLTRHYGPLPPSQVIANGRRPQDYPRLPKRPFVLAAGRVWDEAKNMRMLLAVAPHLFWPVRLAGERQHPQGGLADVGQLQPLGRLTDVQMAEALGAASIYVHPARYEPFGLGVLEAALAGCALVLGDIPSLRELWQGAALFVPADDPAALQAGLETLIAKPHQRARWAALAHRRAMDYRSDRMVGRYRQLYQDLLEEERSCIS